MRGFVVLPGAALALMLACGESAPFVPAAPSSPVVLADAATVMPGTALPADLCERTPPASNLGLSCLDGDFCGAGGLCVPPIGAAQSVCTQVCFARANPGLTYPSGLDTSFAGCDTCPSGEFCATVLDASGAPVLLDLNLDGTKDVVAGACQPNLAGTQAAWQACGSDGACDATSACIALPGREQGTCFPTCTDRCFGVGGLRARCSRTTTDASVCLIACERSDPASCPSGLTCAETAVGNFTCVR